MLATMNVSIRPATVADIPHLAAVKFAAYGGYAELMYADSVPGLTPKQILELRLEQENATSHFSNGWIAEVDGVPAGGIQIYPADLEQDDPPDLFVPMDRIPYLAFADDMTLADSFFLDAIAVFDGFRSHGVGTRLMEKAIEEAGESGLKTMSLVAFAENATACELYRRHGFEERIRRPATAHPALRFTGDFLLMAREL